MSSLLLDVRAVLEEMGYQTSMSAIDTRSILFEDDVVLGVLFILESPAAILEEWERCQDAFLRENSRRLSIDPYKAWNSYTVLLTDKPADRSTTAALFAIEEDFRGTRKIVRAGVSTRSAIESALSPIAPLRRLLSIAPDDIKDRLSGRLADIATPLESLLSEPSAATIARALLESP